MAIKRVAVVGATGRVGHHAVDVLRERGFEAVPVSRASGVDVISGAGLAQALTGVDAVIDAATGPSPEREPATAFFTTAAANLHAAGRAAGVSRLVVVSIIGIEHLTGGYGAAKLAHERAALAGRVPARILRAAQFHEFIGQLVDWGRSGDTCYVQPMRIQPVAARAVAEVLVDLTVAEPFAGPIAEVAGPREENLADLAARLVSRRGDNLKIDEVRDPDDPDAVAMAGGLMLPGPHATLAGPTFADWLDQSL